MERIKQEVLDFKWELEILEKAIIWIRQTIDFKKSEEIFVYYNEIKFHNINWKINYNLCFNKIDIMINELQILWIEPWVLEYFYRFRTFIWTKVDFKDEWVKSRVENIIYL